MFELSDLRIFLAVIQEGGISRAAAVLHRVQSNVTTRVRQLEEAVGTDLFIRDGKRLRLSPAGKLLQGYAEKLLALASEAQQALGGANPAGTLRLGSMESTAATRLPAPLARFHARYPEVNIELRTGATQFLLEQVLSGELDTALVAAPVGDGRLETLPVYTEELVIAAAAQHPPIHSPADLDNPTMITFQYGCAYRLKLDAWFAAAGLRPERLIEMSSYHGMLSCVAAGTGIALVPRSVLATFPQPEAISLHPLASDSRVDTLLIWRKGEETANVVALRAALVEVGEG